MHDDQNKYEKEYVVAYFFNGSKWAKNLSPRPIIYWIR